MAPAALTRPHPPAGAGAVVAVLTAAGSGTRLGQGGPKALVQVGGRSLLARAAQALAASGVVDQVVVTAPPDAVARFAAELPGSLPAGTTADPSAVPVGVQVVAGSAASRQASVSLGLQAALAACPDAQVVLVHDAARALTPPQVVRRVVEAVRAGCDAVVPALPVTDTVKQVAPVGEGRQDQEQEAPEQVVFTPDRSCLRAVQTPQGFRLEVLRRAHEQGRHRAEDEAAAASDDATLVEAAGGAVHVVPGDPLAFKVTTPLDLAMARLLVEQR